MTKFFTNAGNAESLFDKFAGIAGGMSDFHRFLAVTGYFRSSGYFRLRRELDNVKEIKILVGINLDNPFRAVQARGEMWFGDEASARKLFNDAFIEDIKNARYAKEVEDGILQMIDDLKSGRLELRIHPSKNLHAKFYLCLPEDHTPNTDGWVIMGSSNLTDEGLGIKQCDRYEMNVAMKDFDDVAFCKAEFDRLWEEGKSIRLDSDTVEQLKAKTYLGINPTPWEVYMKVLITYFGAQAEDDFSARMPDGMMTLKYQTDAVIQAYQMLDIHGGCILGDVVGLGKTVVAVMIACRFYEENGSRTKILVACPPGVVSGWRATLEAFKLKRHAHIVSSHNLIKVIEGGENLLDKSEYDMVIVDEAHNFRNARTNGFDELQTICKSPRANPGPVGGRRKRILLLSATAVNNSPEDLKNELLLFQDARRCTIENIPDLNIYFAPKIKAYNDAKRRWKAGQIDEREALSIFDKLYEEIRDEVIDKLTVRRTRKNILNNPDYKSDLDAQGIRFPKILPPHAITYEMAPAMENLFWETRGRLARDGGARSLSYARYRAIEFLKPKFAARYPNAKQVSDILSNVYQTFMVKRLESSLAAFRKSVANFIKITEYMIRMFAEDKVLIIPEMDVNAQMDNDDTIDEIIDKALSRYDYETADELCYHADDFEPELLDLLKRDLANLREIQSAWSQVADDPKFERFVSELKSGMFLKKVNPSGKLVIFSESVETVNYLKRELAARGFATRGILAVTAENRKQLRPVIERNFDANAREKADEFNILITSDTLAEGVNLHAANVIVNYDTPWNATRLIQRVGRVNRIGSTANEVHNYLFYPSKAGNEAIALKQISMMKAQGFQSALGEDGQIYSIDEIVREFKLFDENVRDATDRRMEFLREVRALYAEDRLEYKRIKSFPAKIRCFRADARGGTVAFIASNRRGEFTLIENGTKRHVGLVEAADILKAAKDEAAIAPSPATAERHFREVNSALDAFREESFLSNQTVTAAALPQKAPKTMKMAYNFLSRALTLCDGGILPDNLRVAAETLRDSVANGIYQKIERDIAKLAEKFPNGHVYSDADTSAVAGKLTELFNRYFVTSAGNETDPAETEPAIIISETFE